MNVKSVLGFSAALALAACAATPTTDPALESARAAVRSAEADPNVNQYAALDLSNAQKELQIAETAMNQHKLDQVDQPAYLATQLAKIAQVRAAAKADDARVASGQSQRDQIMLEARQAQLQQANEQAARLQAEIDQLKATPTSRGIVLTLGDVLFDTGKADLKPGAARKMDELAQFLTEHPNRRVEIDGFTDSTGTSAFNEALSLNRADAVKGALLSRGIDASRISTQGFGSADPVASNSDPSGRQQNRRVEVVIGNTDNNAIAPRS